MRVMGSSVGQGASYTTNCHASRMALLRTEVTFKTQCVLCGSVLQELVKQEKFLYPPRRACDAVGLTSSVPHSSDP